LLGCMLIVTTAVRKEGEHNRMSKIAVHSHKSTMVYPTCVSDKQMELFNPAKLSTTFDPTSNEDGLHANAFEKACHIYMTDYGQKEKCKKTVLCFYNGAFSVMQKYGLLKEDIKYPFPEDLRTDQSENTRQAVAQRAFERFKLALDKTTEKHFVLYFEWHAGSGEPEVAVYVVVQKVGGDLYIRNEREPDLAFVAARIERTLNPVGGPTQSSMQPTLEVLENTLKTNTWTSEFRRALTGRISEGADYQPIFNFLEIPGDPHRPEAPDLCLDFTANLKHQLNKCASYNA